MKRNLRFRKYLFLLFAFFVNSVHAVDFTGGYMGYEVLGSKRVVIKIGLDHRYYGNQSKLFDSTEFSFHFQVGDLDNPKSPIQLVKRNFHEFVENTVVYSPRYTNLYGGNNPNNFSIAEGEYRYWLIDTIDLSKNPFDSLISKYGNEKITFYASNINGTSNCNNLYKLSITLSTSIYLKNVLSLKNIASKSGIPQNSLANYTNGGLCRYSPACLDPDGDKQVIKFKKSIDYNAIQKTWSTINFRNSYTLNVPYKTYVGSMTSDGFGSDNPTASIPRGFNFDTLTGEMYFYKSESATGFINYSIQDFRLNDQQKWICLGESNYQINHYIGNYYEVPEVKPAKSEFTIIEGDSVVFDVTATGLSKNPMIETEWITEHPSMRVSVSNKLVKSQLLKFRWKTDSTCTKKPYYYVYFNVWDTSSKVVQKFTRFVKINVKPRVSYRVNVKDTSCNTIYMNVLFDTSLKHQVDCKWTLKSKSKNVIYSYRGNGLISDPLENDTYYIQVEIAHDSLGFKTTFDSLILSKKPEIIFKGDSLFCSNQPMDFNLNFSNVQKPITLNLNSSNGIIIEKLEDYSLISTDTSTNVYFKVTDALGCVASDSIELKMHPKEGEIWSKLTWYCTSDERISLNIQWPHFTQRKGTCLTQVPWIEKEAELWFLTPSKVKNVNFNTLGMAELPFIIESIDTFGCNRLDTIVWLVKQPLSLQLIDSSFCQNTIWVELNNLISNKDTSIPVNKLNWKLISAPTNVLDTNNLIQNQRFFVGNNNDQNRDGNYKVVALANRTDNTCVNSDTVQITIKNEPVLVFDFAQECYGKSNLDLTDFVWVDGKRIDTGLFIWDSYNWSKTATELKAYPIFDTRKTATDLPVGDWQVKYIGPLMGCSDTGYFNLNIQETPVARIELNTPNVMNIHAAELMATNFSFIDDNSKLDIIWDAGVANSTTDTSTKNNFVYQYPKIVGNYQLSLIATSQFGCKDTAVENIQLTDFLGQSSQCLQKFKLTQNGNLILLDANASVVSFKWYNLNGQLLGNPSIGLNHYELILKNGIETSVYRGIHFVQF